MKIPISRYPLRIKTLKNIPNASIAINGAVSGQTDNHGQFVTKVKFNQIYNITASHDGYQSASVEKQVIQGNATDSVKISLEKTMDWGFLEIIVIVVIRGSGPVCSVQDSSEKNPATMS